MEKGDIAVWHCDAKGNTISAVLSILCLDQSEDQYIIFFRKLLI